MQEKLNNFMRNEVWHLVPCPNQNVVGTKWVFRHKQDEHGVVTRNKVRLVAKGYSQVKGLDFDETYAHVARIESIRILLANATYNGFSKECGIDFSDFEDISDKDISYAFIPCFWGLLEPIKRL